MIRDLRWLIIFAIIIGVLVTAGLLNSTKQTDVITRVEDSLNIDDEDLKIDWTHYKTSNITLKQSLEITKSGIYHVTGTLLDGNIIVKPGEDGVVKLILDNTTINNSNGPAIACYSGDDLVIELVGTNTITDGSTYSSKYDEDVKGAIYSKSDLTFEGDGTLELTGNYEDGIISKDDLTFRSGTYSITAGDDGIRGKDSVHIADGNFTINASADAIKSTNEVDTGKGFVLVENGNFNLKAGAKGVKSTKSILIHDGNFAIETTDDSIHSDGYIGITDGNININAGDDAIHANRELEISGSSITIAKSYEGLEAQKVTITDGIISVTASDDGINAGGGADKSSQNRPGANIFKNDEKCVVSISGGNIYINASGDGIDSNGWVYINGGLTVVDGPTDDGNGALDASMGIIMNGGEAIAVGASGMAESFDQTSGINSLSIFLNQYYPKHTTIEIVDSEDDVIISHTSAKTFNHIAVATPIFKFGETYSLYLDDELYANITVSGIVTTFGNNSRPGINKSL